MHHFPITFPDHFLIMAMIFPIHFLMIYDFPYHFPIMAMIFPMISWPFGPSPNPSDPGYEGSGNGFLVRAVPRLRQARPGLQMQQLSSTWRWTEGCPLEAGWFPEGVQGWR